MHFRHELAIYGNGPTIADPSGVHAGFRIPPRCGVKVLAAGLLGNGRAPHPMTGDIYIGVDDHSL